MVNWQDIDTVLLDMDGTLLDLHFDSYFWLEHLPRRYAQIHELDQEVARTAIQSRIEACHGTLGWYCLEQWSESLKLDVRALKQEVQHKIQIRPHVETFLTRLQEHGKRRLLITNAHPQSLSLKLEITAIDRWLDGVISSHELEQPKEEQAFWHRLQEREAFDPERTLFVDDSLPVLDSARRYGIRHLLSIHQPDSQVERWVDDYPAIHHFDEITPPPLAKP